MWWPFYLISPMQKKICGTWTPHKWTGIQFTRRRPLSNESIRSSWNAMQSNLILLPFLFEVNKWMRFIINENINKWAHNKVKHLGPSEIRRFLTSNFRPHGTEHPDMRLLQTRDPIRSNLSHLREVRPREILCELEARIPRETWAENCGHQFINVGPISLCCPCLCGSHVWNDGLSKDGIRPRRLIIYLFILFLIRWGYPAVFYLGWMIPKGMRTTHTHVAQVIQEKRIEHQTFQSKPKVVCQGLEVGVFFFLAIFFIC